MAQGFRGVPPGPLSAYLGVREGNLDADMQAMGFLAKLQEAQEARRLNEEFRRDELKTKHLDRQAQLAGTLELGRGRLQQQANQLEMQNQFNQQRIQAIQDEAQRKREADAWQRTYQQGQLDIQRENLQIRQQLAAMKAIPGDEPLKAPELLHYIDKEGNHPPAGSTLNDVMGKGYRLASTQEINMVLAGRGAESTISQLEKYVENIWGKEGEDKVNEGIRKRMMAGASLAIDRAKQSNPDLNSYEAFGAGTLAPLIRAIGEKGALAEGDIQRGINLIPKTGNKFGELPDTSVVARQKMKQLRQWFEDVLGKGNKAAGIPKISTDQEYDALPSGTVFIDPEGNKRRKP